MSKRKKKIIGWLVCGTRIKSGRKFNTYFEAQNEMHRQMRAGARESGISEIYEL